MILPELKGAKEVAVLVKCMPNLDDCAELIEQFARTAAAGARLDATIEAYDRIQEQIAVEVAR